MLAKPRTPRLRRRAARARADVQGRSAIPRWRSWNIRQACRYIIEPSCEIARRISTRYRRCGPGCLTGFVPSAAWLNAKLKTVAEISSSAQQFSGDEFWPHYALFFRCASVAGGFFLISCRSLRKLRTNAAFKRLRNLLVVRFRVTILTEHDPPGVYVHCECAFSMYHVQCRKRGT
jgi:hypothetical protein